MDVNVRGVDPAIWRKMRTEAVSRGWTMAEMIERMWELWLDQLGAGWQPDQA